MPGQGRILFHGSCSTWANSFCCIKRKHGRGIHTPITSLPMFTDVIDLRWNFVNFGTIPYNIIMRMRNYEQVVVKLLVMTACNIILFILQFVCRHWHIYIVLGHTNLNIHTNQRITQLIFFKDGNAVADGNAICKLDVDHVPCFVAVVTTCRFVHEASDLST